MVEEMKMGERCPCEDNVREEAWARSIQDVLRAT